MDGLPVTAESLKFEKYLFLTRSAPYDSATAFSLFVQRVETVIISENRSWKQKSFNLPKEPIDELQTETPSLTEDDESVRTRS